MYDNNLSYLYYGQHNRLVSVSSSIAPSSEYLSIYKRHSTKSIVSTKSGGIPLDSARSYRVFLPSAASQFVEMSQMLLTLALRDNPAQLDIVLSVLYCGSEKTRLNNRNRNSTVAFRYFPNDHYYISISQAIFPRTGF